MPGTDSAMTPGRKTRVIFDSADYALTQGLWGGWRWFDRVASLAALAKGADSAFCSNMHLWATGAWTLRPKQLLLGNFGITSTAAIMLPGSGLSAVNSNIYTFSPDRPYDKIFRKKTTNGGNYTSLSAPAKVTSFDTALSPIKNLRPLAKSTSTIAANIGLCLRFRIDGLDHDNYDYVGAMIFGQYGLALRGNGLAEIWEYGTPSGGSAGWQRHISFRYASERLVTGRTHHLTLWPHVGVGGEKYIAIHGLELDSNEQSTTGIASTMGGNTGAGSTAFGQYAFQWQEGRTTIANQAGSGVTTSAQMWMMEREDLRCLWQVSTLDFETSGFLLSETHASETLDSRAISINAIGRSTGTYTLSNTFKDSSGSTISPSSGAPVFYIRWDMAGDGADTPILWAYKVERSAANLAITPGSFTVSAQTVVGTSGSLVIDGSGASDFAIRAFGSDPRSETASLRVMDLADNWPRLRTRSKLPIKIVTKDNDGTTDVTLFRGYAISPHRTRLGKPNRKSGLFGQTTTGASTVSYPSAQWSSYQIEAVGMWEKLSARTLRTTLAFENFAFDTATGTSALTPWKVTDAIKHLLTVAGFPSSMQRIPDLSIRLNPGIGTTDSDRILEPNTSIAEMIVRLARNYLGRFLVFDANSGSDGGQWTLVGAPTSTTPLAAFVGGPTWNPGDATFPVARLASYASQTYPILDHRESYFIPPDCNHLWAFTLVDAYNTGGYRVDNHMYNYTSYKVPGSSVNPDPDSPHYIPEGERLITLADPTLWAGGAAGGWQSTQAAVNFVMLRLFPYLCLAREVLPIRSALVIVTDATTGNRRPLRFYDPVSVDGVGYYVRSAVPAYQNDRIQTADYELERLVQYKPVAS